MTIMNRKLLAVALVLLLFITPLIVGESAVANTQDPGQWVLQSVYVDGAEEPDSQTYAISDGSARIHAVSETSGDVFSASGSWTQPKDSYQGEEIISIVLTTSVDEYIWNGTPGQGHSGINAMNFMLYARLDIPDLGWQYVHGSAIYLEDDQSNRGPNVNVFNGDIIVDQQQFTVSAVFPSGARDGDEKTLYISSSIGAVRYNYVWQQGLSSETSRSITPAVSATPAPDDSQQIILTGGVRSIDNKPMRNLQLDIEVQFRAETENSSLTISTVTDLQGLFKADVSVPDDTHTVKFKIIGKLTCQLPGPSITFYLVDVVEPEAQNEIWFSTTFDVELNRRPYKDETQIQIHRLLHFGKLQEGYLSIDDLGWKPDAFASNIRDSDVLAAYSYHYVWAWNAQYTGAVIFRELESLKKYPVRIEMRWAPPNDGDQNSSHYTSKDKNVIRLTSVASQFDDQSRFVLLHEYGHHFDTATLDGYHFRTLRARLENTDHTPHGGYLNSSTSDSTAEGFATAYAAIVQKLARSVSAPHITGSFDLGQPGNYVAWKNMGLDEELAIATLYYQAFNQFDRPLDFWQVLKPDYPEFIYYYQELEKSLNGRPEALNLLQQAALLGGLYKMPFGNGQYDPGEPFRDLNGNGQYDPGEPFGDLMFDVGSDGKIDPEQPLMEQEGDLVLGQSSPANLDRQSTFQLPGSYLYLTGEPVSHLLITIMPDREAPTQILRGVEQDASGQKLYLGLVSRPLSGKVRVTVPGGSLIFEGDIAELQSKRDEQALFSLPLASATVLPEHLPAKTNVLPAPVYGDPEATGIFSPLTDNEFKSLLGETARLALQADPLVDLQTFSFEEQTAPTQATTDSNRQLILIIAAFIVLLIAAVVIILLLVSNSHKKSKAEMNIPAGYTLVDANVDQVRFCANCGTGSPIDSVFCGNCGQKTKV